MIIERTKAHFITSMKMTKYGRDPTKYIFNFRLFLLYIVDTHLEWLILRLKSFSY